MQKEFNFQLHSREELNEISSQESEELSELNEFEELIEEKKKIVCVSTDNQCNQFLQIQQIPSNHQSLKQRARTSTDQLMVQIKQVNQFVSDNSHSPMITNKSNFIKRLVSKQKQRYQLDGFDLDLTCKTNITNQLIAMGYPSESIESFYRNSMDEVRKFYNLRHPHSYKIYNLCAEKKYDHGLFNNRVVEYPFYDHQPPPFDMILKFCKELDTWIKQDEKNVAGIHCKAGKGRTGVMACCYLLYSKQFSIADDALRYYAIIRTKNRQGVTIPSQIRYVKYFQKMLQKNYKEKYLQLSQINLVTIPNFKTLGGCNPTIRIQNNEYEYVSKSFGVQKGNGTLKMFPDTVYLKGDVLIQCFNNTFTNRYQSFIIIIQKGENVLNLDSYFILQKICSFQKGRNRLGLQSICNQLSNYFKQDKDNKYFSPNFKLELFFNPIPEIRNRSNAVVFMEKQFKVYLTEDNMQDKEIEQVNEEENGDNLDIIRFDSD